ncbi:non-ribosomal peptide synthetase [Streptomyces lucensis]|nr:non-ribosomal peptide synthetase [Streptomyces lucensis]
MSTAVLAPHRDRDGEAEAPASFTQRRMVFLHGLDPESPAYNSPAQFLLTGRVDTGAIEEALNGILARHDVLRTRLPVVDGEAVQQVTPFRFRPLPVIDLTGLSPGERTAESDRLVRAEQGDPFDLAAGPLVRFRLVRLAEDQALVVLTFHHAVVDGWSFNVLSREFDHLYGACLDDRVGPLPPLPLQYADYAHWQQDWLHSDEAEQQIDYWATQLADAPEVLNLPVDRRRTAAGTRRGEVRQFLLPTAVRQAVEELSAHTRATPFMVLLAAFQVVLARYCGQDDILVGTPVANRRYKEFHDLIGFFVNSVALRGRPRSGITFLEFLDETRTTCLDAYEHQDVPLDILARRLHPDRELGRNPIFQVNLAFHNQPEPLGSAAGATVTPLELDNEGARFDLDLVVSEVPAGLECRLIFAADLLDRSTVSGIADSFQCLLRAALQDPQRRLGELLLLSPEQSRAMTEAAHGPRKAYAGPECVHSLFQEQAERTPEAVAVRGPGGECITYRELDRATEAFAHHLRSLGVRRGSPVAVLLDRSPDCVTALLGVLRAGAAYVPLDPDYPRARLEYMLRDSGARYLVTDPALRTGLDTTALSVTSLDAQEWTDPPTGVPALPALTGDDLMYIMYTSGSTGGPKGVMMAHRQVVNYLQWAADTYAVGSGDGVPVHSSLSFDLTVTSLFAPLLRGQKLLFDAPAEDGTPPVYAARERTCSLVKLTPSHLRLLEGHGIDRERHTWTDVLVIGGEALAEEQLDRWRDSGIRLVNEYGPTETAVGCTAFDATSRSTRTGPVSIGTPIPNTSAHVLDDRMRPVPDGAVGELYIGGSGVSYGYLGRGDRTAERFVPDPFSVRPGARLYRTGDLARRGEDGLLFYLGRADQQVKIRGHRIEPGEVEAALDMVPTVRRSVVVAEDEQLVAFLEVDEDAERTAKAGDEMEADRVGQWRMLYNTTYGDDGGADDLAGWTSSYTGRPIEEQEMQAWLDDTVSRILALAPRRVLEIGCGTGLILTRVAPHCDFYRGADLSSTVVDHLRAGLLAAPPEGLAPDRVELVSAAAHEVPDDGVFDTVVVNSVLQYFPSVEYLLRVLDRALSAVSAGGHVFLGDVRNADLLPLFHTSIAAHRATAGARAGEVRARAGSALADEDELCLAPRLFPALQEWLPQISSVRVLPKRGGYRNELSCYRYDVILTVAGESTDEPDWLPPDSGLHDPARLEELLRRDRPAVVGVPAVPNVRLQQDLALRTLLDEAAVDKPVEDLVARAVREAGPGWEPEAFWQLAERLPYTVEISWARGGESGAFDVVLRRKDSVRTRPVPAAHTTALPSKLPHARRYANDPLWRASCTALLPEVMEALRERLPASMVPSHLVPVRRMPLTSNGKADTAALRQLWRVFRRQREGGDGHAPAAGLLTDTQRTLARLWEELLGRQVSGPEDDFFALGGHSLLTFQLVFRVRKLFDVDVSTRLPFEKPSLSAMAAELDRLRADGTTPQPQPLGRAERTSLPPASFAQERLWFLQQMEPDSTHYNIPVYLRLSGTLRPASLRSALTEVVRRHEVLRTVLVMHDGRPYQSVLPPQELELPLCDLSALPASVAEAEARRVALQEYGQPFVLSEQPALRCRLLRLSEDEHVLLLTGHHIAFDGWSSGILLSEMARLYAAHTDTRSASRPLLPEPEVQYADYAVWQRRLADAGYFDSLQKYWTAQLDGILVLPGLPMDHPRPVNPVHSGYSVPLDIPADVAMAVRAWCLRHDATLYMGLLAAAFVMLHRRTGETDLVVGTDVAGRSDMATERLIGFFVNQLVLRVDLGGAADWEEVLRRVRTTALDAYAHQDFPFEQLVRALNPRRSRNQNPLFQVKVALDNTPAVYEALPGLTVTPYDFDLGTARSDVSLQMREESDGTLSGVLECDAELFDESTVRALRDDYLAVMEALAGLATGSAAAAEPVSSPVGARPGWSGTDRAAKLRRLKRSDR